MTTSSENMRKDDSQAYSFPYLKRLNAPDELPRFARNGRCHTGDCARQAPKRAASGRLRSQQTAT